MNIASMVGTSASKLFLKFKYVSPKVALAAGIVGVVGACVIACKKTLSAKSIVEEAVEDVQDIKECSTEESESEDRKEIAKLYLGMAGDLVINYAPAVALGGISIAAIVWSHNTLWSRNLGLTSLVNGISAAYGEYRKRVAGMYGEDIDHMLAGGVSTNSVEEISDDGVIAKRDVMTLNETPSIYARIFDETNVNWSKSPEANRDFLNGIQNMMNRRLQARGYVFLNEVYEALGFEYSDFGQLVGWVKQKSGDGTAFGDTGDDFIDFGIYNLYKQENIDFVNGRINAVLLDFNVDGVIYDLI